MHGEVRSHGLSVVPLGMTAQPTTAQEEDGLKLAITRAEQNAKIMIAATGQHLGKPMVIGQFCPKIKETHVEVLADDGGSTGKTNTTYALHNCVEVVYKMFNTANEAQAHDDECAMEAANVSALAKLGMKKQADLSA
jgi:hypothetical protein